MKAKIGYLFYQEGWGPEFYTKYPNHKEYQGKIVQIVYFEIEDAS